MTNTEHNLKHFSGYDWVRRGEEWSDGWGGVEAQWFGTILPRIWSSLNKTDNPRVLEVAMGYGRWTPWLMGQSISYTGVDLCENCVDHCRSTFPSGMYYKNDGTSLAMVEDGSIDFIFSFDSLVHVELSVMTAYVPQMIAKLSRWGRAFVHYSNRADKSQPDQDLLNYGGRGEDVSAEAVRELICQNGGAVLVEEKVAWETDRRCGDAFTLFSRAPGTTAPVYLNHDTFRAERDGIGKYQSPYAKLI